jgi:hypothetical protein
VHLTAEVVVEGQGAASHTCRDGLLRRSASRAPRPSERDDQRPVVQPRRRRRRRTLRGATPALRAGRARRPHVSAGCFPGRRAAASGFGVGRTPRPRDRPGPRRHAPSTRLQRGVGRGWAVAFRACNQCARNSTATAGLR